MRYFRYFTREGKRLQPSFRPSGKAPSPLTSSRERAVITMNVRGELPFERRHISFYVSRDPRKTWLTYVLWARPISTLYDHGAVFDLTRLIPGGSYNLFIVEVFSTDTFGWDVILPGDIILARNIPVCSENLWILLQYEVTLGRNIEITHVLYTALMNEFFHTVAIICM